MPSLSADVLVVGGGGREHAIAIKLRESPHVRHVYCAPGNGGTAAETDMSNVALKDNDITGLVAFAKEKKVSLVFVGPETPLCAGLVDACADEQIPCFGPSKGASILESSKAFSKDFFARHNLPTAAFKTFQRSEYTEACAYVSAEYSAGRAVVVKASGLAGGKGVLMPQSLEEAKEAVKSIMVDNAFGSAGDDVVIEEFLDGEECSCMAFSDGQVVSLMPPAQDHKRVGDGDEGPNTGGMGAYAPAPCATPRLLREVHAILQRTVEALAAEGRRYVGVLYGGFMLARGGRAVGEAGAEGQIAGPKPRLLEYNCRLGDPETQVLLPLLDSDLFEVAMACIRGELQGALPLRWKAGAAATVVCAAPGYPGPCPSGLPLPLQGLQEVNNIPGVVAYHAGTRRSGEALESSGGRVLAVTGLGVDLQDAVGRAYQGVKRVLSSSAKDSAPIALHHRRDIGRRALERPTRVALVGSTRGSSSQATIDAIKAGDLNAEIVLVASNKGDAGILERARREGLRWLHLPCKKGTPRAAYDAELTRAMREEAVDLVLLVGYMRIVSEEFCRDWEDRCINVHPSLLPKHAGGMDLEVHQAVLDAAEAETGCTVHLVTELVDGGACLLQRRVPVKPGDTAESLKARVQAEEGPALAEAVRLYGSVLLPAMAAAVRRERKRKAEADADQAST